MMLPIAHHGGSSLNQRMTPATNALDERRKPENMQQNSYTSALDPANNQALIMEVIIFHLLHRFSSFCGLSAQKHLTLGFLLLA
jgi:hypothetical protein